MGKQSIDALVFGGTFDPIHEGHVGVLRELLALGNLVVIAPTQKNPWKKQSGVDFELRVEMIRMVLEAEKLEYSEEVCTKGIYLCSHQYVYVSDFVKWWRGIVTGSITWVVGDDIAHEVENWKDWGSLELDLYVAKNYADNLHSTDVRNSTREFHPAIRGFVQKRRLYARE